MTIHYDMSFSDYRSLPGHNWSLIKLFKTGSPRHVKHAMDNPDSGDTISRRKLRAIHAAVLEPDVYAQDFVVYDGPGTRASKAYKTFAAENAGREVLKASEAADIAATAAAVHAHPAAGRLLSSGKPEVTITWTDEATGLPCKGRIDWLSQMSDGQYIEADLKTFGSTEGHRVGRMVADQCAHGQRAHYCKGLEANGISVWMSLIISAEGKGANDVGVFDLGKGIAGSAFDAGEDLRASLMQQLSACLDVDEWPGRIMGIEDLILPEWAYPTDDDGGE